jgi:hypothetical protein
MQLDHSWIHAFTIAALVGCSTSPSSTTPDAKPPLRPGVEDSNQVYKGTPSAN